MTEVKPPPPPVFQGVPPDIKALLLRARDAVSGALQSALVDTLVTEFHAAFQAMWHAPGNRAAAANLRKVDRTHRETAVQQALLALDAQFAVIAQRLAKVQADSETFMAAVEGKLALLGEHVTRLESHAGSTLRL